MKITTLSSLVYVHYKNGQMKKASRLDANLYIIVGILIIIMYTIMYYVELCIQF